MLYYVGTCDAILIFPPLSSLILSYPLLHRLHSSSFQSSSLLISSLLLISVSLMTCTSHPSNPPTNPPTQYLHFTLISSHFKCFHTAIEAPPPLPLHLPLSLSPSSSSLVNWSYLSFILSSSTHLYLSLFFISCILSYYFSFSSFIGMLITLCSWPAYPSILLKRSSEENSSSTDLYVR